MACSAPLLVQHHSSGVSERPDQPEQNAIDDTSNNENMTSVGISTIAADNYSSFTTGEVKYRLYKSRFFGLIGLTILNMVSGMAWPWFGPISNNVAAEFGYSLDQVNWLGNVLACIYLPTSLIIPSICSKYGLRRCCDIGVLTLLLASWIRYAGTIRSLPPSSSFALVMVGQCFVAIAQPIYQVIGPKFSESWFDLKGRTTATMIIAIANPTGAAIGQLLSPLVGSPRQSILVLGVIGTAATPCVLLIRDAPPNPPTYSGSKSPEPLSSLIRAITGFPTSPDARMAVRERIDFCILALIFGALGASTNTFSILTAQIFQPYDYSANESGLFGACLLLSGIIAAVVTAPLFDRVFTHCLALTAKVTVPVIGAAWLSLIWAVRPDNAAGLFVITAVIGACTIATLPVALELAVELTRNANASSAVLWFSVNLFGIIMILVQSSLRAGPEANPPLNMHRALIFNGAMVMSFASLVVLLQGRQTRRERDEKALEQFVPPA